MSAVWVRTIRNCLCVPELLFKNPKLVPFGHNQIHHRSQNVSPNDVSSSGIGIHPCEILQDHSADPALPTAVNSGHPMFGMPRTQLGLIFNSHIAYYRKNILPTKYRPMYFMVFVRHLANTFSRSHLKCHKFSTGLLASRHV